MDVSAHTNGRYDLSLPLCPTHVFSQSHDEGKLLLDLLMQMLIPSGNTLTDTPRSNVLPGMEASLSLVNVTRKSQFSNDMSYYQRVWNNILGLRLFSLLTHQTVPIVLVVVHVLLKQALESPQCTFYLQILHGAPYTLPPTPWLGASHSQCHVIHLLHVLSFFLLIRLASKNKLLPCISQGFCTKMMAHTNYRIEIWVKDLCNNVWADLKQTNMRWTGNTQESLLPRSLKGHGKRKGARTQRELWFCGRGLLNRSCDLRQSGPITVIQDQTRTEQESNDLDLFPRLTSDLLLVTPVGQS